MLPRQMTYIISPGCSGSTWGLLIVSIAKPSRRIKKHANQMSQQPQLVLAALHWALPLRKCFYQNPKILKLLHFGQKLTHNPKGAIHVCNIWQRTIALDLEVLTFILTASHSTANCPCASLGSESAEVNRTISSAKNQNQWQGTIQSPTPTRNMFDFLPRVGI